MTAMQTTSRERLNALYHVQGIPFEKMVEKEGQEGLIFVGDEKYLVINKHSYDFIAQNPHWMAVFNRTYQYLGCDGFLKVYREKP